MTARVIHKRVSRKVRLSMSVIIDRRLPSQTEIHVQAVVSIFTSADEPRAGWAAAARRLVDATRSSRIRM